ncbi:MAG: T9SS type A sorting domain-containing protein [Bacteroidota bacterium]
MNPGVWEGGLIIIDSIGHGLNCVQGFSNTTVIDTLIVAQASFTVNPGGTENAIHPVMSSDPVYSYGGCVENTIGITEPISNKQISFFPNPSKGHFTMLKKVNNSSQLIIYNTLGDKIFESTLTNHQSEIDLSTQANGIYFYKVTFPDMTIESGKLIVLKGND